MLMNLASSSNSKIICLRIRHVQRFVCVHWWNFRDGNDHTPGITLDGHQDWVTSLAVYTPEGQSNHLIYTGSNDRLIRAFILGHEKPKFVLDGHDSAGSWSYVNDLVFQFPVYVWIHLEPWSVFLWTRLSKFGKTDHAYWRSKVNV